VTADPAPPPLSLPLSTAGGVCPRCGEHWRFRAPLAFDGRLSVPAMRCGQCGAVLGHYAPAAGQLWLRVVCGAELAFDTPPP